MINTKQKTRQSAARVKIESDILEAYNLKRKQRPQLSPSECYTAVGLEFNMYYYQVQYIVLKARKAGKKVL